MIDCDCGRPLYGAKVCETKLSGIVGVMEPMGRLSVTVAAMCECGARYVFETAVTNIWKGYGDPEP